MNTSNLYWYPIKVKINSELIVFKKLLNVGLKAYLPLERYCLVKGEREFWKLKPLFKGIIFINCNENDIERILSIQDNVKFFKKGNEYLCFDDMTYGFLKKTLTSNSKYEIVKKELNRSSFVTLDTVEYGKVNFDKTIYKEKEFAVWRIPVLNYSILLDPECVFVKHLMLDFEESYTKN